MINDEEPTNEIFRNFIENKMAEAVIRVCPKCGMCISLKLVIAFVTDFSLCWNSMKNWCNHQI